MNKVTVGPINSIATVCYSATTVLFVSVFCKTREMCKKKKKKVWKRRRSKVQCYPNEHYIVPRASSTGFHISSYFTISRSYFINYNILFYHIPSIQKLYYFTILLKYYFLIFLYYFSSTLFLFQIQPFQLFQIQLFQRSIFNNLQFFLFSFSISFQLFQQPGCIFFFNFFPTISTTCQFFFFFFEKEHAKY